MIDDNDIGIGFYVAATSDDEEDQELFHANLLMPIPRAGEMVQFEIGGPSYMIDTVFYNYRLIESKDPKRFVVVGVQVMVRPG